MSKKKKTKKLETGRFLQCMHCGHIIYDKENETPEELEDRFMRTHVIPDHLSKMFPVEKKDLPLERQKIVH